MSRVRIAVVGGNAPAQPIVKPKPVAASSIPGLLVSLQNEWDSMMLETFTLKKHLQAVRQELSQALYQHEAAWFREP